VTSAISLAVSRGVLLRRVKMRAKFQLQYYDDRLNEISVDIKGEISDANGKHHFIQAINNLIQVSDGVPMDEEEWEKLGNEAHE
jgi:hypothetical protein